MNQSNLFHILCITIMQKHRNSSAELTDKLLAGLSVIDKSHFTGMQKLWILQHLLIPRIQWPLLIYEIPISLAFKLEQKVCLHSKVVTSPSLNIKSLFLFFSISMSIANKEPIISAKSFKN